MSTDNLKEDCIPSVSTWCGSSVSLSSTAGPETSFFVLFGRVLTFVLVVAFEHYLDSPFRASSCFDELLLLLLSGEFPYDLSFSLL